MIVKTNKGRRLLALLVLVSSILLLMSGCIDNLFGESDASKAETYVKSAVYRDLGVVAERFTSDVIYSHGSDKLIGVRYGLRNTNWDGSYCVYVSYGYVNGCTKMLPSGYDFKEHKEELKALFGL